MPGNPAGLRPLIALAFHRPGTQAARIARIVALAGNYFFKRASYSPLFTNLSPQDGAAVIRELEADKIPFQISAEGTSISIPRQVVYQTRLKLAGKGIPIGGGVGFEIFEKSTFGMSEFTQQVNYLRVSELAKGAQVLDCFAFVGGFGLHAARAGATWPSSGSIVIGHFASMTGPQATFGISTDQAIRLAIKERNAKAVGPDTD